MKLTILDISALPEPTNSDLDKYIARVNKKKNHLNYYFVGFLVFFTTIFLEYMQWLNTNSISILRLMIIGTAISVFLFILIYGSNKSSNNGSLLAIETIFINICNDNWNRPFSTLNVLSYTVTRHPVFRTLIGLYACRYCREEEGLFIISKAAQELPVINDSIKNGKIFDRNKFKELYTIIQSDLYSAAFENSMYYMSTFTGVLSTILILSLIVKLLWM